MDFEELELESACGGRLVSIWGKGGAVPIEGRSGKRRFAYQMAVTRIGNEWKIAR